MVLLKLITKSMALDIFSRKDPEVYKQMLKYDVVKELDDINEIYTEEFIQK